MIIRNIMMAGLLTSLSTWALASVEDPIVGKWKTVDDRTGYSRADVMVKKIVMVHIRVQSLKLAPYQVDLKWKRVPIAQVT